MSETAQADCGPDLSHASYLTVEHLRDVPIDPITGRTP